MSKRKKKNMVRGMLSAAMLICSAITAAVFPSYAVENDSISSEGNIVLEDGEVALYSDDIDYLANELNSMSEEIADEDKTLSVPVDYVRKSRINSKGIIDYAGGTVVMNAADLIYIANEMDVFESTYKYIILKYLNDIQTYITADGSVTHNEADSDASYFPTFGQLIKGIKLSQEVNTGTTADNLSEGMGAWINGEYITGNGNDVNAAYSQGYIDGVNYTSENANISYVYHEHEGTPYITGGCVSAWHEHTDNCSFHYGSYCDQQAVCILHGLDTVNGDEPWCMWACPLGHTFYLSHYHSGKCVSREIIYDCENSSMNQWSYTCGKTTSTIESATIVF